MPCCEGLGICTVINIANLKRARWRFQIGSQNYSAKNTETGKELHLKTVIPFQKFIIFIKAYPSVSSGGLIPASFGLIKRFLHPKSYIILVYGA
jgi:hypothetical protein